MDLNNIEIVSMNEVESFEYGWNEYHSILHVCGKEFACIIVKIKTMGSCRKLKWKCKYPFSIKNNIVGIIISKKIKKAIIRATKIEYNKQNKIVCDKLKEIIKSNIKEVIETV